MALVYFKLNEAEFLEYTPLEFNRLLEIKQNDNVVSYRLDMERMRLQTMVLFNIQVADKDRRKTPQAFMPFEWDIKTEKEDVEAKEPTAEEWEHYDSIGTTGQRKKE